MKKVCYVHLNFFWVQFLYFIESNNRKFSFPVLLIFQEFIPIVTLKFPKQLIPVLDEIFLLLDCSGSCPGSIVARWTSTPLRPFSYRIKISLIIVVMTISIKLTTFAIINQANEKQQSYKHLCWKVCNKLKYYFQGIYRCVLSKCF